MRNVPGSVTTAASSWSRVDHSRLACACIGQTEAATCLCGGVYDTVSAGAKEVQSGLSRGMLNAVVISGLLAAISAIS